MLPADFLTSSPTRDRTKRKASLPNVNENAKKLRLEAPPISSDSTMELYQDSVQREAMTVMIPFNDDIWRKTQERIDKLEQQLGDEKESRMWGQQQLHEQNECLKQQLREQNELQMCIEQQLRKQNKPRMRLFAGNVMIDMAKYVFGECCCMHLLKQLAAGADDKQLSVIPTKYWKSLRSLSKFVQNRNETAHESEAEFAGILLADPDKSGYEFWKHAFPLLYKGTIEEVAARICDYDTLMSLR